MNDRSPLRRFVRAYRDFGFIVATKVAYSKIRGMLCPALALPDAPVYNTGHREVSFLLSTAEQSAGTLAAVVVLLAGPGGLGWEVCICERSPAPPEMARAVGRLRGTHPRIRIVTTDETVDEATATRWTVEQATGQFVALVAPGYAPKADAIVMLLAQLRNDPGKDAAGLVETDDCRLLLQRKSGYLAAFPGRWPLSAPALAKHLDEAGVSTAYVA